MDGIDVMHLGIGNAVRSTVGGLDKSLGEKEDFDRDLDGGAVESIADKVGHDDVAIEGQNDGAEE